VAVSKELFKVVSGAVKVSRMTSGAFDPSWAAMHGLWDFRPDNKRIPSKEELEKALPLINYKLIELDPDKMTVGLKEKGMAIGLGGIAKGYAVDRAMERLSKMGIRNAIIKAGGDVRVQGRREGGEPWRISIQHPREEGVLARLPLSNISISTSGDYERYFMKDSILYHHIIDPETGYPARGCQSVTILAPDTMTSDAFATAVFVLGPEKGLRLVERLNGVEAIIVDASGTTHTSSGIDLE
ncbi:MAG: FAD:protein FMN transferase, partial [Thermodesulfobacteriota bacterium]